MDQAKRKRALDAAYKIARLQRYEMARGRCERCAGALRDSFQTHHVIRRSNSGRANHDVENLRALCPPCHAWIHANVKQAKADGWIKTEWPQL